MTARLIMIGLDAMDSGLVDRWMREGAMPCLAALNDRGVVKVLTSPHGSGDDGLWASFQYGVPLGEHGRYHWTIPRPNGTLFMAHERDANRRPFWLDLGDRGLRTAVLDIPKCAKPQPLNGIHLADWLVHGRYFDPPRSQPDELAAEIVARFGSAPHSRCSYNQEAFDDTEITDVVSNLRTSASRKRAAGLHYLNAEAWDLFLIGFKEAHCGSHALWNFVDEQHASYDAARNFRLGEPLKSIFTDLDAAVGDLIAAAGHDAEVVVFSTIDMKSNGTLNHLMPGVVDNINRYLGGRFCEMLPYNDNHGALRIIAQGADGERIAAVIANLLRELVDAESGVQVVRSILRPAVENKGMMARTLPDLLLACSPNCNPRAIKSPSLGLIASDVRGIRPGNHADGGFLIAAGHEAQRLAANVNAMEDFAGMAAAILSRSLQ